MLDHGLIVLCISFGLLSASVCGSQDLSAESIKKYELQSQMDSDLGVANKVLDKGEVDWLQFPLSELQVASLQNDDLRKLRNAIFAKYGYRFKSNDLMDFFSRFNWYNPQTEIIPSEKLTENEKYNVELIQYYEKRTKAITETQTFAAKDLVGMWHQLPMVPSGWMNRFFLYSGGEFAYKTNQMDGTRRLIAIVGTWKLEENRLIATISSKEYLHGGEIAPPPPYYSSKYIIENATIENEKIVPPLKLVFPLSNYVAKYDFKGELPYSLPYLIIGAREYWKMYDNPREASD